MRKQIQDPERFDCLRTCVASIFDLDRLEVPNFGYSTIEKGFGPSSDEYAVTQTTEINRWFLDRAIGPSTILLNEEGLPRPGSPWGICIAMGEGPRGLRHAIVWDAHWWAEGQNSQYGEMVHDPHPSGAGLLKVDSWICFAPLKPPPLERNN